MALSDLGLPSTSKWTVELPPGHAKDSDYGGCRNIEDNYTRDNQIGEGTYGEVYLATSKHTREKVALKKIRMDNEKEGFPITAIREIKLLKMIEHENVITLKEIVRSQAHAVNNMKGSIYMVFDYMDHDLTGLMERRSYKMEIPHIKCYMKQLLKGLQFCHAKNILHRDLKASNLLINNEGILKIADFGLARTKDETTQKGKLTNRVITLWYSHATGQAVVGMDEGVNVTRLAAEDDPLNRTGIGCIFCHQASKPIWLLSTIASERVKEETKNLKEISAEWMASDTALDACRPPELILGSTEYGPEIDIWSVGCIFAELLTGQPLFPGKDEADQLDRISKVMGTPCEQNMPGFSKLNQSHMIEQRYKENKLVKHLQSKKVLDPRALELLSKLLEMDPKKRITAEQAVLHDYFYADPQPAQPHELPKFAPSHELDMKKLRQEAKHKHAPTGQAAPTVKRARHGSEAGPRNPEPLPQQRHTQQYDNRGAAQRHGGGVGPYTRTDAWDTRSSYADHRISSSGHIGDARHHASRSGQSGAYPPGHQSANVYGIQTGLAGFGNYGGGAYAPGAVSDRLGYPMQQPQGYRSHPPQHNEVGEPPTWAKQKR